MDYKQLRVEMIQAMRGSHSKYSLNNHFQFTYDKIGSWEKPSTTIYWNEFIAFALKLQIPIASILQQYVLFTGKIDDGKDIIFHITKGKGPEEVAQIANISCHRIRRIFANSIPRVEEVMQIIHAFNSKECLLGMICEIAGEELEIYKQAVMKSNAYIQLSQSNPLYSYCSALLHHHDVVHNKIDTINFMAKELGSTEEIIQSILEELIKIGIAKREGNHICATEKFHPFGETVEEQLVIAAKYSAAYSHFLNLPNEKRRKFIYGYYNGTISDEALIEIQEELNRSRGNIMRIIGADKNKATNCIAISLGLFDPTVALKQQSVAL